MIATIQITITDEIEKLDYTIEELLKLHGSKMKVERTG